MLDSAHREPVYQAIRVQIEVSIPGLGPPNQPKLEHKQSQWDKLIVSRGLRTKCIERSHGLESTYFQSLTAKSGCFFEDYKCLEFSY